MARLLGKLGIIIGSLFLGGTGTAYAENAPVMAATGVTLATSASASEHPTKVTEATARSHVAKAIWEASEKTGVSYRYLLAQAHLESGLDPKAQATTSSATGLFQFIDTTWLSSMERHGRRLGVDTVAAGKSRDALLDMRKDAKVASLMAAGFAQDNARALQSVLGREANDTELYLAHFLGSGGAKRFLTAWRRDPGAPAAVLFPDAARANAPVFYSQGGQARSLSDVLAHFDSKMQGAVKLTAGLAVDRDTAGPSALQTSDVAVPQLVTVEASQQDIAVPSPALADFDVATPGPAIGAPTPDTAVGLVLQGRSQRWSLQATARPANGVVTDRPHGENSAIFEAQNGFISDARAGAGSAFRPPGLHPVDDLAHEAPV
ncbi:transglycosylase SLT domain-containing protein [Qipengyuania sp. DSG2-2]|uniref:transglycosylase SLT domain-containing protein n=1 Tax=Qipengyuania sp. DGS2-2 TaxID=3349631 RepID=UPI0036D27BB1